MKTWQKCDLPKNCFLLPHEVFELGLERGALLVYLFLIHHKYLKHSTDRLCCAAVCKAVGLCEKTVRTHLHTLASAGLIRVEYHSGSFSYSLRPIQDKVRECRSADLLSVHGGGRSA